MDRDPLKNKLLKDLKKPFKLEDATVLPVILYIRFFNVIQNSPDVTSLQVKIGSDLL